MPLKANPKNYNQDDLEDRRRMELEREYEEREIDPPVVPPSEDVIDTEDDAAPVAEAANGAAPDERDLSGDHLRFRSITDIIQDLSKPISPRHIRQRKQGGNTINYVEWHTAVKYLDYYAPGWDFEVRSLSQVADRCVVIVRISIPCLEGMVYREATGSEEEEVKGYGDPISNSEAMALKRAAAKFGLGLSLYQTN